MDIFSALKILFYVGSGVASYKSYKKAKKLEKQANQLLIQKYGTGGGIPVAYGTRRVAGTVLYANTINNRELFVVYAIAVGEIDSIGNIKIGGRSVADTSVFDHYIQRNSNYFGSTQDEIDRILDNQDPPNKPRMVFNCHLGETDQVADPMLVGCIPEWTSNHRLRGIAYIAANFDYDSGGGMFTGLPEITCDIRGKKLYDPRLDSTVTNGSGSHRINDPSTYSFSDNSSLVLLDYLTNTEYGKSLPTSVIDMQSFMDSANKNTTEQTFSYSASVERLSDDDTLRFKKTTANLAVYTALKVGNPITIKIGSTTYASGTVIGKTNNSRRDAIEDEYKGDNPSYIVQDDNLYIIQLSDGAVTTPIDFNPTAVSIDITSNQDRFPFNGVIDTEESVFDNAKKILANMRGIFNYINGIYSLKIEDSESVALSIDDDDILESGIKVSVENKEEKYNIVEVEFANAQKDYELDTINYKHTSETQGEDYTYDDGGEELKLTMEMPYVTNANIAYQNAKAVLLRSRNNKNISFTGTHKLLYVKVGELISITNSQLGMSNEQYRVTRMTINHDLTININAIIYQSNIYGYVTPPTENIDIPDDMVDSFKTDAPTNLNFVDKDPTTGVQPYLTWTNPTTYPAYEFRVIVKDSNDNIKYDGRTKNNFFNLTGIEVDTGYTAEVKSLNTNYVESKATIYNFNNSVPPVQNDDLGSGSVTDEKVSDISANKITAGTIDASVITVTNLDADNITSGSIGADRITVDDLSAINSDLGDIDAGSLNIGSGAFVVTTAGAMTATSADVVGNLQTGNLVVTGDAGIHGEVRATSITAETVTVESIKQEVWNEIDRRTAPAQNGFYDDFSSTGADGYYVGVAKNFDLLGTNDNGYQINSKDIDLRAGMVTGFATSTNYTGTALEATFQYFYKLASDSTWTALTPSYVGTTDKYTTPDGYFYELDADPSHRINSGTLTAESYYHFRLTVTPTVTNNVWTDSDAGSGYKVEYGVQQSSTGTGTGTGTVTSVSGGDGITASPSSITTTGSLAVDSTVVRTSGVQTIGGDKTFSDDIVIQGNLDVQGTTTTIDTTNLDVKDKNITLNYGTGDTSANANGAGITIQDAVSSTEDATLTWNTTNDSFNFSHDLNVIGDISSSADVSAQTFTVSSSGYGSIEVGGVSGAYIDLKTPNTDDFDLRLTTTGTGGEIDTGSGDLVIKRQGSTKIATTSSGIDVTGIVVSDGLTVAGNTTFNTGDVLFTGASANILFDQSANSLEFADNAKATFGSSNDLQIYHDGSHSYIKDVGTGNLFIDATSLRFRTGAGTETYLTADGNGAVNLYYDNSPKLATTSTGINVTGAITSTSSITAASGGNVIQLGTDGNIEITRTSGGAYIDFKDSSSEDYDQRIQATSTGHNFSGTISNSAFTIPNSIGTSGQVLKVPSSGTTLEWGNDTGLITSITNFADNRLLTASGSTTINGEADLTWNDVQLAFDSGGGSSGSLGAGGVVGSLSSDVILTSTNRLVLGQGGYGRIYIDGSTVNIPSGLHINGSQVITSARNLTNIGTISSGAITSSGNIVSETTSGNHGIKIITGNTAEGFLIFGDAQDNSMGGMAYNNSTNSLDIDCNNGVALSFNSSRNATFSGTISSGAITSTGASSIGSGTLHVSATENRVGINTNSHIGTVLNILDVDDEGVTLRLHTNTNSHNPVLRMNAKNSSGSQQYADIKYNPDSPSLNFHVPYNESTPTLKIADGSITVDGTISSGAITSTGTSTFGVATASSYKVGASTVISSSRNLLNIGTISSGAITSSDISNFQRDLRSAGQIRATGWYGDTASTDYTGMALEIGVSGSIPHILAYNRNTSSYGQLRIYAAGITLYGLNNDITFDDTLNIADSSSTSRLEIGGTTIVDSSRNLTNIGTISSGDIEIGTSVSYTPVSALAINEAVNTPAIEIIPTTDENSSNTASIRLWGTRFGTANRYSEIKNITDGSTANNELVFDTNGNEALRLDSSQNATFAGTINSGAITSTGKIETSSRFVSTAGISRFQGGIALGSDNDVYFYESSAGQATLRTGSSGAYKYFSSRTDGYFLAPNGYMVGSTVIVDGSRNLTNIGTISSGNINIGAADSANGTLTIHGGGTGNAEGGEIRLGLSADHDGTYDFYRIDTINDDFRIGRQGQTDFYIFQDGLVKAENNFQAGGYGSFGNIVTALAYQVSGTEVINSARNLVNIGTISSGAITSTGIVTSQGNAALNDAQIGRLNFTNTNSNASANPIRASIFAGRQNSAWGGYLSFYTSTGTSAVSEKVRITETGRVGIGTDSPSQPLHVDASGGGVVRVTRLGNSASAYGQLEHDGTNTTLTSSAQLIFNSGGSEAMRLDSSQNLLVGTTSVQGSGGVSLSGAGYVYSSRPSSVAIYADRTGSDGTVQEFRKAGTTVGSIGTNSNTIYIDGSAANTGLQFAGSTIAPRDAGALNDGGVDLGTSSYRFKDLHLSGTISSGAITSSGGFTATIGGIHVADGVTFGQGDHFLGDEGGQNDSETLLLRNGASASGNSGIKILAGYNDGGDTSGKIQLYTNGSTSSPKLEIDIDGNIKMGSTQIISGGSRNLTNIGTISSGKIGVGANTASYWSQANSLVLDDSGNTGLTIKSSTAGNGRLVFTDTASSTAGLNDGGQIHYSHSDDSLNLRTAGANALTLDSSQNATFNGAITANHSKSSTANPILELKNTSTTNEGRYLQFTKNTGSFVGQIGTVDQTESNLFISTFDTGLKFESYITYKAILPCGTDGADVDNTIDLGSSSVRFDDIYATNGTIQTSDRNLKQDIQALTDAEQRVATACKGLIRRFRWQDSVAEKDNNPDSDETARYHFGVIAQDLQDAFTAEGLDAGDYGMFISSTWTDDDGVEQTRLGVRYNELLAFIISTL